MSTTYFPPIQYYAGYKPYRAGVTYDIGNGKFVVAFAPDGGTDAYKGLAVVVTVDQDGSYTVGTPVIFRTTWCQFIQIEYDHTTGKIAFVTYNEVVIGTVSGSTITFGTPVTIDTGNKDIEVKIAPCDGKIALLKSDGSNRPYVMIGEISGTTISFGTAVEVTPADSDSNLAMAWDSDNDKLIVLYDDYVTPTSRLAGVIGTITGTSISFGTGVVFNTSTDFRVSAATYDTYNQRIVVLGTMYSVFLGDSAVASVFVSIDGGSLVSSDMIPTTVPGDIDDSGSISSGVYNTAAKQAMFYYERYGAANYLFSRTVIDNDDNPYLLDEYDVGNGYDIDSPLYFWDISAAATDNTGVAVTVFGNADAAVNESVLIASYSIIDPFWKNNVGHLEFL